jgi:hypothetical protein
LINAEKSKFMLMSHHQNASQNHYVKTVDGSFENVKEFRYLEGKCTKICLSEIILVRHTSILLSVQKYDFACSVWGV